MPRMFNNAVPQGKVDRHLLRALETSYDSARNDLEIGETAMCRVFRMLCPPGTKVRGLLPDRR